MKLAVRKGASHSTLVQRLDAFFDTRNVLRTCTRSKIDRSRVYAFYTPAVGSYTRFRLGNEAFETLAGWINETDGPEVSARDVEQDYVARGGVVAEKVATTTERARSRRKAS